MRSHYRTKKLVPGSAVVIWLGALSSIVLSAAIAAETSLAMGAMAGVIGVILTASALALVQIAQAMLEIAANTAGLAGRTNLVVEAEDLVDADDVEEAVEADRPEDGPKVVGRIEPRVQPQGRIEPPLFRPGSEAGGLRAVRA